MRKLRAMRSIASLKRKKRGLELSINFIVMLILGIAMLAGSLILTRNLFSKAKAYQATVDSHTKQEIKKLITQSGDRVVIYPAKVTIPRKKSGSTAVGIFNVLDDTRSPDDEFSLHIAFSKAYDSNKEDICDRFDCASIAAAHSKKKWITVGPRMKVRKDEVGTFPVAFSVPSNAPHGIYVFTAKVCANVGSTRCATPSTPSYDEVKHKIYVKV